MAGSCEDFCTGSEHLWHPPPCWQSFEITATPNCVVCAHTRAVHSGPRPRPRIHQLLHTRQCATLRKAPQDFSQQISGALLLIGSPDCASPLSAHCSHFRNLSGKPSAIEWRLLKQAGKNYCWKKIRMTRLIWNLHHNGTASLVNCCPRSALPPHQQSPHSTLAGHPQTRCRIHRAHQSHGSPCSSLVTAFGACCNANSTMQGLADPRIFVVLSHLCLLFLAGQRMPISVCAAVQHEQAVRCETSVCRGQQAEAGFYPQQAIGASPQEIK